MEIPPVNNRTCLVTMERLAVSSGRGNIPIQWFGQDSPRCQVAGNGVCSVAEPLGDGARIRPASAAHDGPSAVSDSSPPGAQSTIQGTPFRDRQARIADELSGRMDPLVPGVQDNAADRAGKTMTHRLAAASVALPLTFSGVLFRQPPPVASHTLVGWAAGTLPDLGDRPSMICGSDPDPDAAAKRRRGDPPSPWTASPGAVQVACRWTAEAPDCRPRSALWCSSAARLSLMGGDPRKRGESCQRTASGCAGHTQGSGCASGCRAGRARARWRSCADAPVLPRPWTRPWERRSRRQPPLEPRGMRSGRFLNWPRMPRPGRTSSMHLRRAGAGCGARSREPHERARGRPGPAPQAGRLVLERGGRRSAGVPGWRHRWCTSPPGGGASAAPAPACRGSRAARCRWTGRTPSCSDTTNITVTWACGVAPAGRLRSSGATGMTAVRSRSECCDQ